MCGRTDLISFKFRRSDETEKALIIETEGKKEESS